MDTSYVINSYIISRDGDWIFKIKDGCQCFRLDGYIIVPLEEFENIKKKDIEYMIKEYESNKINGGT